MSRCGDGTDGRDQADGGMRYAGGIWRPHPSPPKDTCDSRKLQGHGQGWKAVTAIGRPRRHHVRRRGLPRLTSHTRWRLTCRLGNYPVQAELQVSFSV
jgi:hypothetical protein